VGYMFSFRNRVQKMLTLYYVTYLDELDNIIGILCISDNDRLQSKIDGYMDCYRKTITSVCETPNTILMPVVNDELTKLADAYYAREQKRINATLGQ